MYKNIKEILITKDFSLKKTLSIINHSGIGFVAVVDKFERLIGTITDGDIRRALINGLNISDSVENIMTVKPYFARKETGNRELLSILKLYKIKQLPLVDENMKVVSIVWEEKLNKKINSEIIPLSIPDIGELEAEYIKESIESSWISTAGENIKQFELELSKFLSVKETLALNSGTSALHTALMSIGVKEGDEVIIPGISFIATANVVEYCGGRPVFCDVEKDTWNIDPVKMENLINEKTKAVIAVHLLGNPANVFKIKQICEKHGIYLIEDAAQSLGSKINGKHCGTVGDIGCFSFNGNKIITTGGGGALVSNNKKMLDYARKISNQGRSATNSEEYELIGYNYKMTNIHAAIGLAQMKRIGSLIARRKDINTRYIESLKDIDGLRCQKVLPDSISNHWLTGIYVDKKRYGTDSDKLNEILNNNKVFSRKLYRAIFKQPIYEKYDNISPDSNAEDITENTILLPSSFSLKDGDIEFIINLIKRIYTSNRGN